MDLWTTPAPFHPLVLKNAIKLRSIFYRSCKKLSTCPPFHSQTATPGVSAAEPPTPATRLACIRPKRKWLQRDKNESNSSKPGIYTIYGVLRKLCSTLLFYRRRKRFTAVSRQLTLLPKLPIIQKFVPSYWSRRWHGSLPKTTIPVRLPKEVNGEKGVSRSKASWET